jgi:hypothetical protein
MQSIDAKTTMPGERAGPAVVMSVRITNGSSKPLDLGGVTVDLHDKAGLSAYPVTVTPAQHFYGSVAPGASATGQYVFTVAPKDRSGASLIVNYSSDVPTVAFTGDLPSA